MKRSGLVVPLVVLVLSLLVWRMRPSSGEEERIEGTVMAAQASYCEPTKEQGCKGVLVLSSRKKLLRIDVPLGTPISDGCAVLSFGELQGRHVVVTGMQEPDGPVALAVLSPTAGCG